MTILVFLVLVATVITAASFYSKYQSNQEYKAAEAEVTAFVLQETKKTKYKVRIEFLDGGEVFTDPFVATGETDYWMEWASVLFTSHELAENFIADARRSRMVEIREDSYPISAIKKLTVVEAA